MHALAKALLKVFSISFKALSAYCGRQLKNCQRKDKDTKRPLSCLKDGTARVFHISLSCILSMYWFGFLLKKLNTKMYWFLL